MESSSQTKKLFITSILALTALCSAERPTSRLTNSIYAQSTGIPGTPTERVNLLADAGYNGIMWEGVSGDLTSLLAALQSRNQKLLGIWRNPGDNISGDLTTLNSVGELVFLYIPAGSVTTEAQAAVNVAKVADLLAPSGRKVAIYPHYGDFVANAVQALRVAKLANRPNVGISFNQCHELRYCSDMKRNFTTRADSLFKTSMPFIFDISINGADSVGSDWNTLIRPLGEGNFDTFVLVKMAVERGFHGSFALQAYGLTQNPATHLANSMTVWKSFQNKLPAIYGCIDNRFKEFDSTVNVADSASCKILKVTGLMKERIVRSRTRLENPVFTLIDVNGRSRHPYLLLNSTSSFFP